MNKTNSAESAAPVLDEHDECSPLGEILSVDEIAVSRLGEEAPPSIDGIVIGDVAGFDAAGRPLVEFSENPDWRPVAARALCAVTPDQVGRQAAILFEGGDPARPVLLGLLHQPSSVLNAQAAQADSGALAVQMDDQRVELTAKKEIVLRCGKASITLTRAGKIILRGAYLLSRSSGVNRIKGGSVQIN